MRTLIRASFCVALATVWLGSVARPARSAPQDKSNVKPEVMALLKESTAVYKAYKSYQHTATVIETRGDERAESKFTLALERPNKFCYKDETRLTGAAVCDGKTFINYRIERGKQYMKINAPATYKGINIVDDVLFRPLATYLIALMMQGDALADKDVKMAMEKAKLRPTVMEGGKKWQVLLVPFGQDEMPYEFYFNAETHQIGKAVLRLTGQPPISRTETIGEVKLNKPIDAAVFKFTPPADATQVDKFASPNVDGNSALMAARFEGKPALDFTLPDREGNEVSLSALKGKVIIVDFWASWSMSCRVLMPILQDFYEKLADRDVVVLAVNTWDSKEDCETFLKKNENYTMPVLFDPAEMNRAESVATKVYDVLATPTTLFIDREGILRKYIVGTHPRAYYLRALKTVGVVMAAR